MIPYRLMVLAIISLALTLVMPGIFPQRVQSLESPVVVTQNRHDSPEIWQQEVQRYGEGGDRLNQAIALSNLSLSLQHQGAWEKAKQTITQGLNILSSLPPTDQQQKIYAQSLEIAGKLWLSMGDFSQALESWQTAGKIYHKLGLTEAEDQNRVHQIEAMKSLGLYDSACELITSRIMPENPICQGNSSEDWLKNIAGDRLTLTYLPLLGDILRLRGDLDSSKLVIQRALYLSSEEDQERLYLSLGNTLKAEGDRRISIDQSARSRIQFNFKFCPDSDLPPDAQKHYEQALITYRNIKTNAVLPRLTSELNQLHLQSRLNPSHVDLSVTKNLIDQHSELLNTQWGNQLILNYIQTAACIPNPDWQDLEQRLQTIIDFAKNRQDLRTESYALGYLGRLYEAQNYELEKAKIYTEKGMAIAQSLNLYAPEIAYQWQWQLGRILEKTNAQPSQILAAYKAAFNTLQSLRQELVASNRDIQFSFRDEVEPVYRKYVDLLLQNNPTQDNLKEARNVIEALQLAELDDFFNDACILTQEVKLDAISPDTAVLYPILLQNKLAVIYTLSNHTIDYTSVLISDQEKFQRTIDALIDSLQQDRNDNYRNYGKTIYETIFSEKLESFLDLNPDINTLVFVLDGQLRNVPMATLYDGEKYLVEKYAIAIAPGLNLLPPRSLNSLDLNLLSGGLSKKAPSFDLINISLSPLPNAIGELQQINNFFTKKSNLILDENFTQKNIKTNLQNQESLIVHLISHGQFSSNPKDTFLLTWDEKLNISELSELITSQSQSNSEKIELLVLSACETSKGDNRAALGLAGVTLRAGTRSTLATLWKVNDQSTAQFMSQFYHELIQNKKSKAQALQAVQQSFLKGDQGVDKKDPFFWGAFVLAGNWI